MTLFRPTYTRAGKRSRARVWWVQASIAGQKRRASTGCRDRRAADEKGRALGGGWEREAGGL